MISVSEARKKIIENCPLAKTARLALNEACGYVLAEIMRAPIDTPHFNQSAMDGYAFCFDDLDRTSELYVSGEVQAGKHFEGTKKPNEAIRIFTGAAMPPGADTVVIQENVIKDGSRIKIKDNNLRKGSNVRQRGAQAKEGDVILKEGHLITPATISFLAGMGIGRVHVYSNPTVSIITTGKELIKPGDPLSEGKVYESNSFGLKAALEQMHIYPHSIEAIDDNESKIVDAVNNQLEKVDILILTGGVSVGDYDFVTSALEKCGVKKIFHKVKQKPGKPIYFGVHGTTLVFGLPGNPASVLTCFYQYVVDAISKQTNKQYFKTIQMPLATDYSKKAGFTFFLKGKVTENSVTPLGGQESYKMDSFAEADCLIELEEEKDEFKSGEMVKVRLIT